MTMKKNQIRMFLYQLYQIYKIKNSKIINCQKKSQALKEKSGRLLPMTSLKPKLTLSAYIAKMYM